MGTRLEAGGEGRQRARVALSRLSPWGRQRPRESRKAFRKTPGGSSQREFLGLMDLTQVAGLAPDHQGMSSPTNRENWGRRSDDTTNSN